MIAGCAFMYMACFALAAAQRSHEVALLGRFAGGWRRNAARALGWLLLIVSLAALLMRCPIFIATLSWIGLLPLFGSLLVLALALRPLLARVVLVAAIAAAGLGLLI